MDKEKLKKALKELKEKSKKRKFTQSVDLIVNLRGLDLKKPEHQMDFYVNLHFSKGKPVKVCGLVGPELKAESEKVFDTTIMVDDFDKYAKEKKSVKKLADSHDYFVAQANIMPKIATAFGRIFGPKRKMPNPKAGCVVPPKANLKPLYSKLQKTIRIYAKEKPMIQVIVGKESMNDEELIDNIMTAYDQLIHHLPQEQHNVRNAYLKLTMGKPIKVM